MASPKYKNDWSPPVQNKKTRLSNASVRVMDVEQLFLSHLQTIDAIVSYIGRANHLDAAEVEELGAQVKFELIDANYAIIRKFEGRSSFPTYLTTVIQRMFYQYRVRQWGKWRPSAEARRLGDKAIALERLMSRDGMTFHEAATTMTTGSTSLCSLTELEAIHARLPMRQPRPVLVSGESMPEPLADADAEVRIASIERKRVAAATARALDAFIAGADAQDQIILRMRFWNMRRVPDIAAALRIDQRKVYKRIERLLVRMRAALEAAGVTRDDVEEMLARGDQEISIEVGENLTAGPSHVASEGIRGDESRRVR
jgi:RNA polymerase sigma factor (sigma-70 family)